MLRLRIQRFTVVVGLVPLVQGQQAGWLPDQINATICDWSAPRVATIRDTVYIDGGWLSWLPGMANGSFGEPVLDSNPFGLLYTLNFSTPFNTSTNISEILGSLSKVSNGNAANNLAPNYYDGGMLANDNEFFLYGGLLNEDISNQPPANEVLGDELFQYGQGKGQWFPGFVRDSLPDGVSRYVAYGGAASAPSENKAWYFGGLHSPTWGPMFEPSSNASVNAINASDTLITLDMATQGSEIWSNVTLPRDIHGRAGVEVVWVPVGPQGILVALGGVTYPSFGSPDAKSDNMAQNKADSPEFMSTIDIYDIAGDTWYQQPTIAGPSQLARGCAVVAPAQDYSSFNIYYYGGYDALAETDDFNDDVWILSLPSFMWMKVSSGKEPHARAGHRCVMPYPDQMVVIGGYTSKGPGSSGCVQDSILQAYNLTDGTWMDSYSPQKWSNYGVPEMIYLMIGGSETGGATMSAPTPTGWATAGLASVFATPYPTEKLKHYYPYEFDHGSSSGADKSLPRWAAALIGVFLGLGFFAAFGFAAFFYRRRRMRQRNAAEGSQRDIGEGGVADGTGNQAHAWPPGQDNKHKSPTDDPESHIGGYNQGYGQYPPTPHQQQGASPTFFQEMPDTPLVELMDTSMRAELGDGAPVPTTGQDYSSPSREPNAITTPDKTYWYASYDTVARSQTQHSGSETLNSPPTSARPDSPALGMPSPSRDFISSSSAAAEPPRTPPRAGSRGSEHNRVVSNATVSSATGTLGGEPDSGRVTPISPESAERDRDRDNESRRRAGHPLRRSIFHEEIGDGQGR